MQHTQQFPSEIYSPARDSWTNNSGRIAIAAYRGWCPYKGAMDHQRRIGVMKFSYGQDTALRRFISLRAKKRRSVLGYNRLLCTPVWTIDYNYKLPSYNLAVLTQFLCHPQACQTDDVNVSYANRST